MLRAAAAQNKAQQTWDQNPNKDRQSLQALFDAEASNQSQYMNGLGTGVIGVAVGLGGWWLWR